MIVGFEIPDRNRGAGMRTKDQGTLGKILKFVNKYYQENRVAPTISEVAAGVGVARSTTHRYIQELSDRDLLDYGRGILSAPESAKMKTAYIAAPLVGSIYCGSPEEEEENVEEYVSLPVSLFGKGDFYILRAKGDSMVDAGIAEGDLLVIERNCPASEGDIVVALDQEQQNTLKRYVGFDNDEKCFILMTALVINSLTANGKNASSKDQ
jgi:repressor LexA